MKASFCRGSLALVLISTVFAAHQGCGGENGSDQTPDAGDPDAGDTDTDTDTEDEVVQWPFSPDVDLNVMNTVSTLQIYPPDTPGFHHGLDLFAPAGTEVYAPISGLVETRYYFWMENDYTYEISIETDEGVRYEIHHIDKSTIPQEIEDLAAASGTVEQGAFLGNVYDGAQMGVESHIHFNVPDADIVYQNPLAFLPDLPDSIAPSLNRVYFVGAGTDGLVEVDDCVIEPDVERCELVLDAHDGIDGSSWDQSLYKLDFYLMVDDEWQHVWGFEFDRLPYADYLVGADEIYWLEPFEDADGLTVDNQIDTTADRRFLYALPLDLETVPNETSSAEMRLVAEDFAGNVTDQTFPLSAGE